MSSLQTATASFFRNQNYSDLPIDRSALTARLATDKKTREDAFRIRHSSYLAGGNIDPRPGGLFSDRYDEMPNSRTVVLYKLGRPVASIRVCLLETDPSQTGYNDIPALNMFGPEIKTYLNEVSRNEAVEFPRAIEINRLVRHPDFTNDYELVFMLFRFSTFFTLYYKTDLMLSCVRRNHAPFYKRMLFSLVSEPRTYPELKFPTSLMICHKENYGNVTKKLPIIDANAIESGCYDGLFKGDTVQVF